MTNFGKNAVKKNGKNVVSASKRCFAELGVLQAAVLQYSISRTNDQNILERIHFW